MKRTYTCIVTSPNWSDHEYTVTTRSALKAAYIYGNADDTVTIYTKGGKPISCATWSVEDRKYIRICF